MTPDEALQRMRARVTPVATETVPLAQAAGRVLAIAPVARSDFPTQDNSAMDGYVVRAVDCREPPTELRLVDAGEEMGPGTAMRVLTGGECRRGA
ncbi:MAG: molybdopterin molybdenumtransferase MoeA, partial [Oscillatoriales cyanobacterium SM2_1_8]|nr:molybdopterin molybdenumtransferase MoeA [Oscillatoriales cyanobacterium SM2_1_8]